AIEAFGPGEKDTDTAPAAALLKIVAESCAEMATVPAASTSLPSVISAFVVLPISFSDTAPAAAADSVLCPTVTAAPTAVDEIDGPSAAVTDTAPAAVTVPARMDASTLLVTVFCVPAPPPAIAN